jgi:hypothetical protein
MILSSFMENDDWTLTPKPHAFAFQSVGGGTVARWGGVYNVNQNYVLTIKAGAVIDMPAPMGMPNKQFTFATEQVANFTTAPLAITAQSPAENARVVKAAADPADVVLTFNQTVTPASLLESEFTLTKADGTPTGITPTIAQNVDANGNPVRGTIRVQSMSLPAGQYKFTLKQGATIEDNYVPPNTPPNVYTQAADRVINFTIANAPPAAPPFKCLGQP